MLEILSKTEAILSIIVFNFQSLTLNATRSTQAPKSRVAEKRQLYRFFQLARSEHAANESRPSDRARPILVRVVGRVRVRFASVDKTNAESDRAVLCPGLVYLEGLGSVLKFTTCNRSKFTTRRKFESFVSKSTASCVIAHHAQRDSVMTITRVMSVMKLRDA